MAMQDEFNEGAKKTPGEVIREALGEAASDEYRAGIEGHMLQDAVEGFFSQAAQVTQMYGVQIARDLQSMAKELDEAGAAPEDRVDQMVSALAHGGQIPAFTLPPSVDLSQTGLTAPALKNFRGYMMLHAVARAMDFAVEVTGLEDGKPLKVKVDVTKGYGDGKDAHPEYYPDLPDNSDAATPAAAEPEEGHTHVVNRPKPGKYSM